MTPAASILRPNSNPALYISAVLARNIKDIELTHKAHHPNFFIFEAFQHLWLEDTTPHFRD